MLENVYLVDNGVARHPVQSELPWYVLLTLATHSKKHIFAGAKLPPVGLLLNGCEQASNKMKWVFFHRSSSLGFSPSLGIDKSTPPCRKVMDPEFQWCRSVLHNVVASVYQEATLYAKQHMPRFELPKFVSATRSWLRDNLYTAALSDRDGVFCLIDNAGYNALLQTQLDRGWYRPIHRDPALRDTVRFDGNRMFRSCLVLWKLR